MVGFNLDRLYKQTLGVSDFQLQFWTCLDALARYPQARLCQDWRARADPRQCSAFKSQAIEGD